VGAVLAPTVSFAVRKILSLTLYLAGYIIS